jgi:RNA polymerase sigma-70 factor (ECF subfamily)
MHPVTIARSAEHERFVSLYERHASLVLAYARRRIDPAEAEDVLAETFLVAWRRRDDVPDDALPWLYAVAGNVLRNRTRSERRRAALSTRLAAESARLAAESAAQPPPAPDDHGRLPADDDAPDPRLRAALDRLRPLDREALLLTAWEGLTSERAARAAGCSRATFHVRLHRARKRLAQALESETR